MQKQIDQSRETNRLLTLMLQEIKEDKKNRMHNNYDTEGVTLEIGGTVKAMKD